MTATIETTTTFTARPSVSAWDLADALKATLLTASKDQTLPILATVQVTKTDDVLTLTATDRYRLVEVTMALDVTDVVGGDWTILVDTADAKRILTAMGKRTARGFALPATLDVVDDVLTVRTFDAELRIKGVDGTYPKVRSLFPTESAGTEFIGFNPAFMADLCKMPRNHPNDSIVLRFNGPTKPMTASWETDNVKFRFLLMPVRQAS